MEKWKKRSIDLLTSLAFGSRGSTSVVPYYPQKTEISSYESKYFKRAVPDMAVISSGISFLGGGAVGVLAGAIREGWFDMAGFGRQTLAYPDVAKDLVTKGEMDQGRLCLACGKCTEIMRQKGGTPGCVVRDGAVYAPLYRELVLKK